MEQQKWIENEINEIGEYTETIYEKYPGVKLQENKVTNVEIDYSVPWEKKSLQGSNNKIVLKAIIPCYIEGERHNFWLNVRNPLYRQLLNLGLNSVEDIITVKIMQVGKQENTKYILVE